MSGGAKQEATAQGIAVSGECLARLYRVSGAERFGFIPEDFAAMLSEVASKYLVSEAAEPALPEFYSSLHLEELVLARACAAGNDRAWEIFLNRYREKLYDAAEAIAREESVARELADSLYAELFGLRASEGTRSSKLNSYMGRGSLEGWLKAILAQEYVNRYRAQKRLLSLDEQIESGAQFQADDPPTEAGVDPRLEAATDEALQSLSPEERLILACYFLDGRTLAEIARMLAVHESTISRRVEKITKAVRKQIIRGLERRGMRRRQAEEALESDIREFSLDVRQSLQGKRSETVP